MENGGTVTAGNKKDIESFKKTDFRYYYVYDTVLEDGVNKYAGNTVSATDKIPAGTTLRVELTVKCSATSPYTSDGDGTTIYGYFRVIDKAADISKFTAKILDLRKCNITIVLWFFL
jgi:hypothetical protein